MIEVKQLSYTYPKGAAPAVCDLSFSVKQGEVFGFLGPSGSGKSTTQKILIGLLKGYQGTVKVLGHSLNQFKRDFYEEIGVSFELPHHFNKLTALENLNYFASLYSKATTEPIEILEELGLHDSADIPVGRFSKGMKNRLSLARALIHKPAVLFLDEPSSGLDPLHVRKVKDIILSLRRKGKTVFLTTHDMSVAAELCDRVGFIVEGKLKLTANPTELAIKHQEPVVQVRYLQSGTQMTADFPLEGLGYNESFLSFIRQHKVLSIHSKDATLENIFIKVTGRNLT
ncbi:ABC transporter ATP-binding protein [Candidatus Contubernalis alkaliaceticus]|uniref:ABC transporter ATP-binding protein n=1 Tax=Candidatus Contubernalis alkaliaceticus TaxID=338645 RepID=UPI001F4BFA3C|nr:ABC transporter ATP-binding protein [Candidatus Contubernalis alkalaceticus]UNC92041.1 ABC transporter ATP-binding protein [Candidatus Contubernalis alkalaceticus]